VNSIGCAGRPERFRGIARVGCREDRTCRGGERRADVEGGRSMDDWRAGAKRASIFRMKSHPITQSSSLPSWNNS